MGTLSFACVMHCGAQMNRMELDQKPVYDDDPLVAIDLVYRSVKQDNNKYRLNVVRCQVCISYIIYTSFSGDYRLNIHRDKHMVNISIMQAVILTLNATV